MFFFFIDSSIIFIFFFSLVVVVVVLVLEGLYAIDSRDDEELCRANAAEACGRMRRRMEDGE